MLRVCDAERRHGCAVCMVRARGTPGVRAATPRALVAAAATTNRRWFFFERERHSGVRRWLGRQESMATRRGRERRGDDKVAFIGLTRSFYAIGHRFGDVYLSRIGATFVWFRVSVGAGIFCLLVP
jgi:hypothetical protein